MLNRIDLSRTDLNLLVLFDCVLQERHVGRAAERLSLSPSAVSHGLGRLRRLLNDPLFLRTPKGVVPTDRAAALAAPVAEILAQVNGVIASAAPFDAARSTRRFTIAAPDAVSAVILPNLLARLRQIAPGIAISVRQLLPTTGRAGQQAWSAALDDLEARHSDVALAPFHDVPARFTAAILYDEDFVIAMRKGHAFSRKPTLQRYCEMQHLVVSQTGDTYGLFDEALAKRKMSRRVVLTVSSFMQAMALLAETDLVAALPRRLVAMQAARFGLTSVEPPLPAPSNPIRIVATRAAIMDQGVAWLFGELRQSQQPGRKRAERI